MFRFVERSIGTVVIMPHIWSDKGSVLRVTEWRIVSSIYIRNTQYDIFHNFYFLGLG